MTTNNNGAIGVEEYEALQSNEFSEEEIKQKFLTRFKFAYNPGGGYRPKDEAEYLKRREYKGYYINYSFPPYGMKPIASVWAVYSEDGVEKFKPFHFDLDKFTTLLIDDLDKHGFKAPPPVKFGTYKKPATETDDDKPF